MICGEFRSSRVVPQSLQQSYAYTWPFGALGHNKDCLEFFPASLGRREVLNLFALGSLQLNRPPLRH